MSTCECPSDLATLHVDDPCGYKRTSQLLVFLLQLFLGWIGVGVFVLGWTTVGIIIIMMPVAMCFAQCCTAYYVIKAEDTEADLKMTEKKGTAAYCINCGAGIVWASFWIAALVWIVNDCVDSNGIECYDNL